MNDTAEPRWKATVSYRTAVGSDLVTWWIEEIGDLEERIEHGPHWDTVERIVIVRVNHNESKTLTVEEASQL